MNARFPSTQSGIAIGPILFILAILAVIATVMAAGMGDFGGASITDRVSADIVSQANLIRAKVNECNIMHGTDNNYDGFPSSDPSGTLVSALNCDGDPAGQQNIWTGQRATQLPPPTTGFGHWYYVNTNASGLGGTATGGRCIWSVPTGNNPGANTALIAGLTKAASKFTHNTTNDGASEVVYDPASGSQKFVLWITLPTGTPDAHCLP